MYQLVSGWGLRGAQSPHCVGVKPRRCPGAAPLPTAGCQLPRPVPLSADLRCTKGKLFWARGERERVTLPGLGLTLLKRSGPVPGRVVRGGRAGSPQAGSSLRGAGRGEGDILRWRTDSRLCPDFSAPSVPQFPPVRAGMWRRAGELPVGCPHGQSCSPGHGSCPGVRPHGTHSPPVPAPPCSGDAAMAGWEGDGPVPAVPSTDPLPTPTPALPLSSLQEKRKRQTEIENKRRQLEDDRRQLQHLKVRIPRDPRAASAPRMCRGPPGCGGRRAVTPLCSPVQGSAGEMAAGGSPDLSLRGGRGHEEADAGG